MKGQQWSLEAILAITVFLVVFIFLVTFITSRPLDNTRQLELQSVKIYEEAKSPDKGFVDGTRLDYNKMDGWYDIVNDPERLAQFKKELGLTADFCIYFEDANGTRGIPYNNTTTIYYGLGDPSITIGEVGCGQPITP